MKKYKVTFGIKDYGNGSRVYNDHVFADSQAEAEEHVRKGRCGVEDVFSVVEEDYAQRKHKGIIDDEYTNDKLNDQLKNKIPNANEGSYGYKTTQKVVTWRSRSKYRDANWMP